MRNRYARIFAIIRQLNSQGISITHTDAVRDHTCGKKDSLKDLTGDELQALETALQDMTPKTAYTEDKLDATRKAIIAQFLGIGRTAADAIEWAEKYGVSGVKRAFNEYTGQELYRLLQNAKKMQQDFIKSVNKGI